MIQSEKVKRFDKFPLVTKRLKRVLPFPVFDMFSSKKAIKEGRTNDVTLMTILV
jgi:hypothetical protein